MRRPVSSLASLVLPAVCSVAILAAPAEAGPGKPANFQAMPKSTIQATLTWEDTSDNETLFRVQQRVGSAYVNIGSVPAGHQAVNVSGLTPGSRYEFRVLSFDGTSFSTPSQSSAVYADSAIAPTAHCASGANEICLGDRFRLAGTWRAIDGGTGVAVPQPLAASSAAFYFFAPDNLEILIKVLDACGLNARFWVFYAATTNVEFTLTVTDTKAGTVRKYFNPLDRPASPVQDTSAFATCP